MEQFFERLSREESEIWQRIHQGEFSRHVRTYGADRELYIAMMTEIFHYTRHNAQNQALAALRLDSERLTLLRYCLHHAYSEAGHDQMVIKDLSSIGVAPETIKRSKPLPETEAFVAYLYRIATERDATARLGYSYWAENAYAHTHEFIMAVKRDLKLEDSQMTFFIEHSDIDVAHFDQVKRVLQASCTTPELQEGVLEVLRTTLHLTGNIMEAVYRKYRAERRMAGPELLQDSRGALLPWAAES